MLTARAAAPNVARAARATRATRATRAARTSTRVARTPRARVANSCRGFGMSIFVLDAVGHVCGIKIKPNRGPTGCHTGPHQTPIGARPGAHQTPPLPGPRSGVPSDSPDDPHWGPDLAPIGPPIGPSDYHSIWGPDRAPIGPPSGPDRAPDQTSRSGAHPGPIGRPIGPPSDPINMHHSTQSRFACGTPAYRETSRTSRPSYAAEILRTVQKQSAAVGVCKVLERFLGAEAWDARSVEK